MDPGEELASGEPVEGDLRFSRAIGTLAGWPGHFGNRKGIHVRSHACGINQRRGRLHRRQMHHLRRTKTSGGGRETPADNKFTSCNVRLQVQRVYSGSPVMVERCGLFALGAGPFVLAKLTCP